MYSPRRVFGVFCIIFPYFIANFYCLIKITNCNLLSDVLKEAAPALGNSGTGGLGKLVLLNLLSGDVERRTPEGKPIYEGDIVGDPDNRKGVRDDGQLWPGGIIPYIFHNSVVSGQRKIIHEAMHHWEENTCIRFREKTLTDLHYIRFRSDTAGCWSSVGKKFIKIGLGQDISLGIGCSKFFTAVHEIGHSIGFYHEHARSDRDGFVKILWENVKSGMSVQFELRDTRNEEVEYDYRSIMHYPSWAFSKNPLVKNTIVSRNPLHQYLIDEEKDTMSFRDAKITNILYKCSEQCPNFQTTKCYNNGYLSAYKGNGNNCVCMCPPGFHGSFCEFSVSNDHSYYGPLKCGGNITYEGVITTPNYPTRKEEYQSCGWWIQAPEGMQVRVTFEDFSFCPPYDGVEKPTVKGKCLFESVEIRKSDIYAGTFYCGEQIKPETVIQSDDRNFIILIIADDQMIGRGLKANIKFVPKVYSNSMVQSYKNLNNNRGLRLISQQQYRYNGQSLGLLPSLLSGK